MDSKTKILIGVLVVGLLIVGWWGLSSNVQKDYQVKNPTTSNQNTPTIKQGVYGVVTGLYGADPSNSIIEVREYFEKDQKTGNVVANATADKNGFYEIALPQGNYSLRVVNGNIPKGTIGVSNVKIISIGSGLIEQDLYFALTRPV